MEWSIVSELAVRGVVLVVNVCLGVIHVEGGDWCF